MSLIDRFSTKTFCIGLSPGQFFSVIRDGAEFVADSAVQQTLNNPDADWQSLVSILQSTLMQSDTKEHGLPIEVVLSSRWCRMMMVPWSDAMLKEDGAAHFIQSQYIALYGEAARDWVITADEASYGQPRLTCAIEGELLYGLRLIALENKKKIQSVEPIISSAWRAVANLLGANTKAFAIIEADRITLACTLRGRITAIQSQACARAWPGELVRAWQRWMLRAPELAGITQVAVVNLTGHATNEDLPKIFKLALLPTYGLEPAYGFLACGGGR